MKEIALRERVMDWRKRDRSERQGWIGERGMDWREMDGLERKGWI